MLSKTQTPWGWWEVLLEEEKYKLKRILVKPKNRLSYQTHTKRKEHWMVVEGEGTVTLNEEVLVLTPGQTIDIGFKDAHRMENKGDTDLVFIELQTGSYFGEDDIVRLKDDYGRAG